MVQQKSPVLPNVMAAASLDLELAGLAVGLSAMNGEA